MTTRRYLLVTLTALLAIAAALALAELLDAPWLALGVLPLLIGIGVAREIWQWRGAGRTWLAIYGTMLAVIAVAFIAQRLAG